MAQSGYNISDLVREGQIRWLKPAEVLFILQNHETQVITHEPPQKPASGSLFLFNKRVLRFFRKDGHSWRRKRDGRTISEAHERLKVGNVEALNCYYAHGEQSPNFQRRSYWMLDPACEHIVLVHYRDVYEGRNNAGIVSQFSPVSSLTFSQSSNTTVPKPGSSALITESYDQYQSSDSPGSVEINSNLVRKSHQVNYSGDVGRTEEDNSSSELEICQALRKLEEQLSLNDDSLREIGPFYSENEFSGDLENVLQNHDSSAPTQDYGIEDQHKFNNWKGVLDGYNRSDDIASEVRQVQKFNENGMLLTSFTKEPVAEKDSYTWLTFGGSSEPVAEPVAREVEDYTYPDYSPAIKSFVNYSEQYTTLFDQGQIGLSLEDDLSFTIAEKQKFTIREISPEWGYASEATKVVIIGSFLCDPSESGWTCMFGDVEVPIQIIQQGVICCHAPPYLPGKVTLYITSGSRESCSEVREFEYRAKSGGCSKCSKQETEARSPEELLLLVRFVQLLLFSCSAHKGDSSESGNHSSESGIDLLGKFRAGEDLWDQVIEALLVGCSTSSITMDWLLQELLKDKLQNWLTSRSQEEHNVLECSLSKKEQGVIHMIAGLGFEWALHPILKARVNINFRDINGWTALHWAARFGREKMVAALIASGASAGAVTDPNPQDPTGRTAAFIAANYGRKGLAGYLSEVSLTSHLSSLTLEESELSKGSADVEAEKTLNCVPKTTPTTNEDQLSLKDTLAAVRNAAQAAARIQSAFRAHSFRMRQQRESAAAASSSTIGDEYGILSYDIQGLSAVSKLAFRNSRDYNSSALSIQKKYRGWKGRKDFLALRQKVVKIQAYVRGHQVRKNFKVCWAVGILEKVVLRWRRRGVGLRGFQTDCIDEIDDEDILKVFRKQKVDPAIDEAVSRVLSMVESPEARQQYHRILEKYRQNMAELEVSENKTASSSYGFSNMENDDIYQVA